MVWIQSFSSPRLVTIPSLAYNFLIAGRRMIGFIAFPKVLALCEMQTVQDLNSGCRVHLHQRWPLHHEHHNIYIYIYIAHTISALTNWKIQNKKLVLFSIKDHHHQQSVVAERFSLTLSLSLFLFFARAHALCWWIKFLLVGQHWRVHV